MRTDGLRRTAVAAIFLPGPELLFIQRAVRASDRWSGQIGFPGGHVEPDDTDLLHTAMRETHEELGLHLPDRSLLGPLDDLPVYPAPNMMLRPFVFALDRVPDLNPNEEVAGVHRVPLADLVRDVGRGTMNLELRGQQMTLPRVDFQGQRLWGLTLRVVDDLLHRLDGRGTGLRRLQDLP